MNTSHQETREILRLIALLVEAGNISDNTCIPKRSAKYIIRELKSVRAAIEDQQIDGESLALQTIDFIDVVLNGNGEIP